MRSPVVLTWLHQEFCLRRQQSHIGKAAVKIHVALADSGAYAAEVPWGLGAGIGSSEIAFGRRFGRLAGGVFDGGQHVRARMLVVL
jgi:hypothetical protein